MVFSNDMEYDNNEVTPTIGAFYATIGKKNTKYTVSVRRGRTVSLPNVIFTK